MKLPRFIRWRVIHWRARARLIWWTRIRPSPLQREFNRGDPEGKVRAVADEILAEIEREDNERPEV